MNMKMKESIITSQVFASEAPVLFVMECTERAGFTLSMNVREISYITEQGRT
jgi:hypothetical protein